MTNTINEKELREKLTQLNEYELELVKIRILELLIQKNERNTN